MRDVERPVLAAAGALFLGIATTVFLLIVVLCALFGFADSASGLGLGWIAEKQPGQARLQMAYLAVSDNEVREAMQHATE